MKGVGWRSRLSFKRGNCDPSSQGAHTVLCTGAVSGDPQDPGPGMLESSLWEENA